jgi:threonyl-tRNA synthetase
MMSSIRIHIAGHDHEVPSGSTGFDLIKGALKEHVEGKKPLAAVWNDKPIDLARPLTEDGKLRILTFDDDEGKQVFWHSTSHILAQAVKRLHPDVLPTLGPPIEEGFYYDFDNLAITEDDLPRIEKEMERIVGENHRCERIEYPGKQEALAEFGANPYKKEIIEQTTEALSAYTQGEFIDLCRGPHLPATRYPQAIKLHRIAGAYWRGDAKNKQLTRIYGISFPNKTGLKEWEELRAEAEKRDHRKIGKELDLFGFDEVSPGSPFFYPKGAVLYNELLAFMRELYQRHEYDEVVTPLLYEKTLWETSGHWQHYQENMFLAQDGAHTYGLKPMNCPSHCVLFNRTIYSYRDLPVRIADFAALHRNEPRGALGGLTRVRKFSQDDAHIFCRADQIEDEISALMKLARHIYEDVFGMPFAKVYLSTRPDEFLGTVEAWEKAEQQLKDALDAAGVAYELNPGDGAFYGPKIDCQIRDALGRYWQTTTIQLDFQMPQRFECTYIGEDSKKHPVVMIHRALLGSLERFIGVLTEHFAGRFPVWLAPEQVAVLPISETQREEARSLTAELKAEGIRAVLEDGNDTLNKRIRDCQLRQIPAVLILGEKEVHADTVALRTLDGKTQYGLARTDFIARMLNAKKTRSLTF